MSDIYAEITKVNPDRQEVFGWASITKRDGKPVVDLQEDYIEVGDLEKSAYEYVLNSRVGGEMHQRMGKSAPKQVGTLIESFVVTPEKVEKMGLPEGSLPDGWWIGFKVNDQDVWKGVKDGKYTGFSIHGKGMRKRETLEEGDSVSTREQLLKAAFAQASNQVEFTKNIAGIADALHEREHPEAHYFGEVVKHLIGNHEQKDHDPNKRKGMSHSRDEHENRSLAGGAGGALGGGLAGMYIGRMNPGVALSTALAGGLGGFVGGAAGTPQAAVDNRAKEIYERKRKKMDQKLSKQEYETLSKYLG